MGELFDQFDYQKKGYLLWQESKEFFVNLFNLKIRRKKHYLALVRLLEEMDIDDFDSVEKDKVLDFFIKEDGYMRF